MHRGSDLVREMCSRGRVLLSPAFTTPVFPEIPGLLERGQWDGAWSRAEERLIATLTVWS